METKNLESTTSGDVPRRSARERLLAAADELFYESGIHSIGIDRVIERAGVAKASLYDTFGSKDALIRSYLEARADVRRARIEARVARHASPRDRVLAVFDAMAETFTDPRFRGCAFTRANAEAVPGGGAKEVCDAARDWMRALFATLAKEAGAARPEFIARQLVIVYDGATVSAQMDGDAGIAKAARDAAALMLDAAIAAKRGATVAKRKASR
jgi:AcrR family transcriptional regulator